jgi:hypothetical protein
MTPDHDSSRNKKTYCMDWVMFVTKTMLEYSNQFVVF